MFNDVLLTIYSRAREESPAPFRPVAMKLGFLIILSCLLATNLQADPPAGEKLKDASPLTKFRTLGGTQFWSDQLIFHDWRIQRNTVTKHYRLLDGKNYRHTWGTFERCQTTLSELKSQSKAPPIDGKVVIVLHGLGRTRNSMSGMSRYLQQHSDYTVLSMSYASTRARVRDHAQSLNQVIRGLPEAQEINFVAHSLGNLVIRAYLKERNKRPVGSPSLGRIVMLAPPNQGSSMARRFKDNKVVRSVWGVSGDEIASHWPELSRQLAVPDCPFGIIAGKSERSVLNNPLIEGSDDLVVTVEETHLPGARDFLITPAVHTYLMDHAEVQVATLRFLQHGYFHSAAKRTPLKPAILKKP